MISENAASFAEALPPAGRLLGLDLGTKTIGLALSDPSRAIATPKETLRRGKFTADAQKLRALCDEHEIVGVPPLDEMREGAPHRLRGRWRPRDEQRSYDERAQKQRESDHELHRVPL